MSELFLKIFNISLSAVWIVCGVILVRAVFRRAPKWVFILLWGLVGLRLLMPALPESPVSLLPAAETVPEAMLTAPEPALHTRLTLMDDALNPILADSLSPAPGDSVNPMQVLTFAGSVVWCAGMIVMLIYAAVSTIRLRLRMKTAVETEPGVYRTDAAPTPFILGVLRPRIYVPFSVSEDALPYVLAHERAHLTRHDHMIKPIAFLLLAVHWFNPFLWLAFVLLSRDIEAACDERVVRAFSPEERAGYSEALLSCSVSRRRMVSACPLAFGEVGVKERVKSVLSYKKPAFWVLVLSLAAAAVLAVCFLTAPKEARNPAVGEYIPGVSVGNVDKAAYEELSPDFAIGADRNGYAVFVHPERAFSSFRTLYADELGLIRDRRGLPAFSKRSWRSYKKAGIEETGETDEQTERLHFVSKFLDIWENSLGTPSYRPAASTAEESGSLWREIDPGEVDELLWIQAKNLADARSVTLRPDRVLVRTDSDGVDHYVFQTKEPGSAIVLPDMERILERERNRTLAAEADLWVDEPEACPVEVEFRAEEGELMSAMGDKRLAAYIRSSVGQHLLKLAGGDPDAVRNAEVTGLISAVRITPAATAIGEGWIISCRADLPGEDGTPVRTVPEDLYLTFVCGWALPQSLAGTDYIADVFVRPVSELEAGAGEAMREKYPDLYEAVLREDFRRAMDDWTYAVRTPDPNVPSWKLVFGSGGGYGLYRVSDMPSVGKNEGLLAAFLRQAELQKEQLVDRSLWELMGEGHLKGALCLGKQGFTGSTAQWEAEDLTVELWRLDFSWDAGDVPADAAKGAGWSMVNGEIVPAKDQLVGLLVRRTSDGSVYNAFGANDTTAMLWYLTEQSYRSALDLYTSMKKDAGY